MEDGNIYRQHHVIALGNALDPLESRKGRIVTGRLQPREKSVNQIYAETARSNENADRIASIGSYNAS